MKTRRVFQILIVTTLLIIGDIDIQRRAEPTTAVVHIAKTFVARAPS